MVEMLTGESDEDVQDVQFDFEEISDFLRQFEVFFDSQVVLRRKRRPVTKENIEKILAKTERLVEIRLVIQKITRELALAFPTDVFMLAEKVKAAFSPGDLIEMFGEKDSGGDDNLESEDLVELVKKFPELCVKDDRED